MKPRREEKESLQEAFSARAEPASKGRKFKQQGVFLNWQERAGRALPGLFAQEEAQGTLFALNRHTATDRLRGSGTQ